MEHQSGQLNMYDIHILIKKGHHDAYIYQLVILLLTTLLYGHRLNRSALGGPSVATNTLISSLGALWGSGSDWDDTLYHFPALVFFFAIYIWDWERRGYDRRKRSLARGSPFRLSIGHKTRRRHYCDELLVSAIRAGVDWVGLRASQTGGRLGLVKTPT